MISCRDIEKQFSCSHGTAVKIMRYAVHVEGEPTEDYWRDLAERVGPHFPKCKGLQNYLLNIRGKESGTRGQKRSTRGKTRQKKPPQASQEAATIHHRDTQTNPADESDAKQEATNWQANDDTTQFIRAAETLRKLTVKTGDFLEQLIADSHGNEEAYFQVLQVSEKLQKLQAELRQTEGKLLEIRRERGELFPREDVFASVGEVWVICAGALDKIVGRLVDVENLPSWIQEVGGSIPDTREARQRLAERAREMITEDRNALADALEAAAVPSENFSSEVQRESRAALAAELERIAGRLRNDQ